MAEFFEITESLSRLDSYLSCEPPARVVLLVGRTFSHRRKLRSLERDGKIMILRWKSILPWQLRWLPVPSEKFFVIELVDTRKLKECFLILSDLGTFSLHAFAPSIRTNVVGEILVKNDDYEISSLAADHQRISWSADLDDPQSESGLTEKWTFGADVATDAKRMLVASIPKHQN